MGYTGTLWLLIGLQVIQWLVFFICVYPKFGEIIGNQKALANNDKIIRDELEIARKAALEARDNGADIKQEIQTLNGLNKEAIRNLPKASNGP